MRSVNAARVLPRHLLNAVRKYIEGQAWIPPVKRRRLKTKGLPERNLDIRAARATGEPIRSLAVRFLLSPTQIWEICRGIHVGRRRRT